MEQQILGMPEMTNREDIIKLAREAGFCTLLPSEHIDGTGGIYVGDDDITDSLKRFTALVAAVEREACAKVCEELDAMTWSDFGEYSSGYADEIRARGEK